MIIIIIIIIIIVDSALRQKAAGMEFVFIYLYIHEYHGRPVGNEFDDMYYRFQKIFPLLQ